MTIRRLRADNARRSGGRLRAPSALLRTEPKADATEIFLYGALFPDPFFEGEISADDFMKTLATVTTAKVTVRINSPGGVITEGMAIFNALHERRQNVTTQVDGLAASMAADILLAGDARRAAGPGAFVMTHRGWGLAIGNDDEIRAVADTLTKIDGSRADIYAARLKKPVADIRQTLLGAGDAWHTANEAKALGLVQEIGGVDSGDENPADLAAAFDLSAYEHAPAALNRPPRFEKVDDDVDAETQARAARAMQARRMRMAAAAV